MSYGCAQWRPAADLQRNAYLSAYSIQIVSISYAAAWNEYIYKIIATPLAALNSNFVFILLYFTIHNINKHIWTVSLNALWFQLMFSVFIVFIIIIIFLFVPLLFFVFFKIPSVCLVVCWLACSLLVTHFHRSLVEHCASSSSSSRSCITNNNRSNLRASARKYTVDRQCIFYVSDMYIYLHAIYSKCTL